MNQSIKITRGVFGMAAKCSCGWRYTENFDASLRCDTLRFDRKISDHEAAHLEETNAKYK